MIATGIILILVGLTLLVFAILFFKGHLSLLHDYHISNVKEEDKKKMSKAIGFAHLPSVIGFITSGFISIFVTGDYVLTLLTVIEIGSIAITVIAALIIIKKYNGRLIS